MIKTIARLLFVCAFVTLPFVTFAQLSPQDITLDISPSVPEPGDTVRISAQSFVTDLNRATIRWTVNGETTATGDQPTTLNFVVTEPAPYRIQLIAQTIDSGTIIKNITITPASVDLLWEATNSYTPRQYRGKPLVAHDGGAIVQAYPNLQSNGSRIATGNLVYKWSINNKPVLDASGLGRDTLRFAGPLLYRNAEVTLDVESTDGSIRARRTITLTPAQPEILFYRENSLTGPSLLNPISNSMRLNQDELVVRAEPYYFSDINNESAVEYEWTIDGRRIITVGDRDVITLRRPEEGSGRSTISLEIKHIGKLLQFARNRFTALFDADDNDAVVNQGETNFFGN